MRILLTGASGFLGRHTKFVLEAKYGRDLVMCPTSKEYELMNIDRVRELFDFYKPEIVVHLAGYVGGIGANKAYPADFYFKNTILTANLFEVSAKYKIKKLIYPIGGCSYPANALSPIDESQFWCGYPQEESAPYSTSKMMGIVAAKSYQVQYGLKTSIIVPGNMYGEFDNFDLFSSHVVPAMIRRIYEAKLKNQNKIVMWGSGKPKRDFVYAADVAKLIPFFIECTEGFGPINISSGTSLSIKNLAELIKEISGYQGALEWDTTKPDGQLEKIFSVKKMNDMGLQCPTKITDGLKSTIKWFEHEYKNKSHLLRL